MQEFEPIDRDTLGPVLGPHLEDIGVIHRRQRALYALGGLLSLTAAAVAPLTASRLTPISGFQALLLSVIALLGTLLMLRALVAVRVKRLRRWFEQRCHQQGVEVAPIIAAARRCPHRFFFFNALWDSTEGGRPAMDVDASSSQ